MSLCQLVIFYHVACQPSHLFLTLVTRVILPIFNSRTSPLSNFVVMAVILHFYLNNVLEKIPSAKHMYVTTSVLAPNKVFTCSTQLSMKLTLRSNIKLPTVKVKYWLYRFKPENPFYSDYFENFEQFRFYTQLSLA